MGSIEGLFIACIDQDDGIMYAPPRVQLELLVIGGVLTLRGWPGGLPNDQWPDEPLFSVDVAAKPTLWAIKTLIRDDSQPHPEAVLAQEEAIDTVKKARRSAGQSETRT